MVWATIVTGSKTKFLELLNASVHDMNGCTWEFAQKRAWKLAFDGYSQHHVLTIAAAEPIIAHKQRCQRNISRVEE